MAFQENEPGRVRLEGLTHFEVAILRGEPLLALLLETKETEEQQKPTKFQCQLDIEQANSILRGLQDAVLELERRLYS